MGSSSSVLEAPLGPCNLLARGGSMSGAASVMCPDQLQLQLTGTLCPPHHTLAF
jgi:hypothetical protein